MARIIGPLRVSFLLILALEWLSPNYQAFNVPTPPAVQTSVSEKSSRLLSSSSSSPTTTTTSSQQETINKKHECKFCSRSFSSRNALFRHVRSDPACFKAAGGGHQSLPLVRQTIAFQIAYHGNITDQYKMTSTEAESAGEQVKEAFHLALQRHVRNEYQTNCTTDIQILSMTQASVANQRHESLSQEVNVAAVGDVVIVSFMAPKLKGDAIGRLVERTKQILKNQQQVRGVQTKIVAFKDLAENESRLHAEISCTQRVYHYLMPLDWLPNGAELQEWWLNNTEQAEKNDSDNTTLCVLNQTFTSRPPCNDLQVFSKVLRSAESTTLSNRRVRRKPLQSDACTDAVVVLPKQNRPIIKTSKRRFGALAYKERRAWHNFADPNLKGSASPNQEPVWKVLDRARIQAFLQYASDKIVLVLEFRGDDFCHQQIRRIVGSAIAMTHDWLPRNFFDVATKPETFIETPIAPPGRLYLSDAKFHFYESQTGHSVFHERVREDTNFLRTTQWIREALLRATSTETAQTSEEAWLSELEHTVAPRISAQLCADCNGIDTTIHNLTPAPVSYERTLNLLRGIVSSNRWPDTSIARSNVIRNSDVDVAKGGNSGSFTVVNPNFELPDSYTLPLGNELFPELVSAVFCLEKDLSSQCLERADLSGKLCPSSKKKLRRPPSSHCAINCNAQFTPHVDSGRGAGQSLSMIVGLGDYVQGRLAIEGTFHDIRYLPLEFDGWSCRHWTDRFKGERFSLVWFTPKSMGT